MITMNSDTFEGMSESWTPDELRAASEAMKRAGHMGYEEFCAALAQTEIDTRGTQAVTPVSGIPNIAQAETFDKAEPIVQATQDGTDKDHIPAIAVRNTISYK